MSDALLQSMSIISPLVVAIISLFIVLQRGFDRNFTVSVHAAQDPKTSFLLTLMILICGTFYYLVLWLWIGPKYDVPFMNILITIAFIGMLILALMPADPRRRWSSRLHSAAGVLLVVEMYVLTLLLLFGSHMENIWVIVTAWVFLFFATLVPISSYLPLFHKMKREVLALEVGIVVLFWVLVILLAYL